MTGFVRGALAVTAGLALLATSAVAGVPSPANSNVDDVLVGGTGGSANPLKGGGFGTAVVSVGFTVEVKDIGGTPISGANVTINFSTANGNSGLSVAANPYNAQNDGSSVDCGTKTISKTTDGLGKAVFQPLFEGAENDASIEVRANGVLLKLIVARSTDTNGNGLTGVEDLAVYQANLYGPMGAEVDWNPGTLGVDDLAILQSEIFLAPAPPVRVGC